MPKCFSTDASMSFLSYDCYRSKLYLRYIYSGSERSWAVILSQAVSEIAIIVSEKPLIYRVDLKNLIFEKISALGIIIDLDAIEDIIRYCAATFRLCIRSLMETNGFVSGEAILAPSFIDEFNRIKVILAGYVEDFGCLNAARGVELCTSMRHDVSEYSVNIILAHLAASGNGEYCDRGLFYRRPFLK